ncbi:MAG TPA: HypC/HybG/HupF family hydrogenase formation chaperone [Spongiibacteraceae bacterium]|nr:HypC/HybG/HupF family hydrogenase formation chaperone [Spongiibacteraceae bacterium]
MCLAIPGQLLGISGDDALFRRGRVAFGALVKEVSLACLPDVRIGDYVLVHAGIALSVLDAAEAQRVFDLIATLDSENVAP